MQSFGVPGAPRKGYDTKTCAVRNAKRRYEFACADLLASLCSSVNADKGISFVLDARFLRPYASRFWRSALSSSKTAPHRTDFSVKCYFAFVPNTVRTSIMRMLVCSCAHRSHALLLHMITHLLQQPASRHRRPSPSYGLVLCLRRLLNRCSGFCCASGSRARGRRRRCRR